jgi:hypothetical protein
MTGLKSFAGPTNRSPLRRSLESRRLVASMQADAARLSSRVLIEAHDEWQDSDRSSLFEQSMALLTAPARDMSTRRHSALRHRCSHSHSNT